MSDRRVLCLEVEVSESQMLGQVDKLELVQLIRSRLDEGVDVEVVSSSRSEERPLDIASIIIALGSAGFFTGLYSVLRAWLEKQSSRKLTLVTDEARLDITGYELEQVVGLLRELPMFDTDSDKDEPVWIHIDFARCARLELDEN